MSPGVLTWNTGKRFDLFLYFSVQNIWISATLFTLTAGDEVVRLGENNSLKRKQNLCNLQYRTEHWRRETEEHYLWCTSEWPRHKVIGDRLSCSPTDMQMGVVVQERRETQFHNGEIRRLKHLSMNKAAVFYSDVSNLYHFLWSILCFCLSDGNTELCRYTVWRARPSWFRHPHEYSLAVEHRHQTHSTKDRVCGF